MNKRLLVPEALCHWQSVLVNALDDVRAVRSQPQHEAEVTFCHVVFHGASEDKYFVLADLHTAAQCEQFEFCHHFFAADSQLNVFPCVVEAVVAVDSLVKDFAIPLASKFVDPPISESADAGVDARRWHVADQGPFVFFSAVNFAGAGNLAFVGVSSNRVYLLVQENKIVLDSAMVHTGYRNQLPLVKVEDECLV